MPVVSKAILRTFFERGDVPTEQQFGILIDSFLNLADDRRLLGLKNYDPTRIYAIGDSVLYSGLIYEAIANTTGPFDATKWQKLTFGPVNFISTWDAATNTPPLQSGIGNKGDYYLVNVSGNTNLDGETDWQVRDWAVFDGTEWQKVDNTDLDSQTAALVPFDNSISGMNATNVQDAIDELQLRIDTNETDIDTVNNDLQAHKANVSNPHLVTKSQVGLGNVENLKVNLTAVNDPSASDDNAQGYVVGSRWMNTNTKKEFVCLDATAGAAVWKETTNTIQASAVSFNPSGTLISTDVQSALQEVDSDIQVHVADTGNPHHVTKSQVGLGNVPDLKVNLTSLVDPGATDDSTVGYAAGSRWLNTDTKKEFVCISANAGAALWRETTLPTLYGTDIVITPAGNISSANVQAALEELDAEKEPANPNIQAHIANTNNPHNVTKAQVGLGDVENLKVNLTAASDPVPANDNTQGYAVGSRWINIINKREFVCTDASTGIAVWKETTNTASTTAFTASGNISSTDVQAAIQELDAEKEPANPNIQAHIANTNNPHNVTKAQVGLGNVENLKVNLAATADPGASDDSTQGYAAGSRWINVASGREFVCTSAATGAAVWKETTPLFGNDYLY